MGGVDGKHNERENYEDLKEQIETENYERKREKKIAPILVYSWGGGFMDVYSCDGYNNELDLNPDYTKNSLLQAMINNGSVEILLRFLVSIEKDEIEHQKLWADAWEELMENEKDVDSVINSLKTITEANLTCVQRLIFSCATVSIQEENI